MEHVDPPDSARVFAPGEPVSVLTAEGFDRLLDYRAPAGGTRTGDLVEVPLGPRRVLGAQRVTGVEFVVTGTDEVVALDAGTVLTSIGYRGMPIRGLPFDEAAGVVPNDGGRVLDGDDPVPGSYVAGWIKRGPTGFIGTN